MVFSATSGTSAGVRDKWTRGHAELAASVPRGSHVVVAGADHGLNQSHYAQIAETINHMVADISPNP